jgi:glycerophosphoryl diester phosphodiesterase
MDFRNLIIHFLKPQEWPSPALQLELYQAHRGYSRLGAIENTLSALIDAAKVGFKMAEIDVQLTKDRIPVLFHDDDFQRLCQRPEKVRELKLAEIRKFYAITTLEEVFKARSLGLKLNIELKTKILFDEPLERMVSELVKKHSVQGRVMFSSFNPFSLDRIRWYLPEVPRALLVSDEQSSENHWLLREMAFAPFLKIHALHLEKKMLNSEMVKILLKRDIVISAWTLYDKNEYQDLMDQGISSLITEDIPVTS